MLPEALRDTIITIAERAGFDTDDLFTIASRVGKKPWEQSEATISGQSSSLQLKRLIRGWKWFLVYDFVEAVALAMKGDLSDTDPTFFVRVLNEYFEHERIAWKLENGQIVSRRAEPAEWALATVIPAVKTAGLSTAEHEIHEAIRDLSRRPAPDLTGAIHHAMGALESRTRRKAIS